MRRMNLKDNIQRFGTRDSTADQSPSEMVSFPKLNKSLGLLTIATNGYVEYLPNLIQSASKHLNLFPKYCHYIFTDDVAAVEKLSKMYSEIHFKITEIPSYGWPEATLLRYSIYSKHKELFDHEILMHLDSDMYFLNDVVFEVDPENWSSGMAFVQHPGFFKPRMYDFSSAAVISRFRAILVGGYGDWETNTKSTAYLPRKLRRIYFCGGAWFGFKEEFLKLCDVAGTNVEIDSQRGITAKWHDESHLNSLAAFFEDPTFFSSRFCYEPKFGNILKNPILLAVDKGKTIQEQLAELEVSHR